MIPLEWYSVSVMIAGSTVDPTALTTEFGIEPTWHHLPNAESDIGAWVIDTKDQVVGNRLVEHLAWLQSRLGSHRTRLQALGDAGLAHLSVRGSHESWDLGGWSPESEMDMGLRLGFVVFQKGPTTIHVDNVRYVDE